MTAVLITGAAGLIGYALGERLAARGCRVLGIDRVAPAAQRKPPFRYEQVELSDGHRLHALLREHPVELVAHCGAVSGPMVLQDNPVAIAEINVVGTANVLDAARVTGVRRVVYCSSCMTYGDTPPVPVTEDAPQRPSTVYAATKAGGELLARAYRDEHDLDTISLRISWVYGPFRQTDCTIRDMLLAAIRREPYRLPWGEGYGRQYVYVADVLQALEKALFVPNAPSYVYNITAGERISIAALADIIRTRYPHAEIALGLGADPQDSVQELIDIGAARRELGYMPEVPIEQGVERYADWLERLPRR